ncbi:MAG: C39 family peptidase [Patescibacteria group bacterium]
MPRRCLNLNLLLAAGLLVLAGALFNPVPSAGAASVAQPDIIDQDVPFTSQAPLGEWRDVRQQDGCEEAGAAMAMAWVGGEKDISKADWRLRILILSTFENKKYGEYRDVSLPDMAAWLFNDYFRHQAVAVKPVAGPADIVTELEQGNIMLAPMNGRRLKNPHYTAPGPERHMILIKGYDYERQEFITNDPGTRFGANYRYPADLFFRAIRDYQTGDKRPFQELSQHMLVVSRP